MLHCISSLRTNRDAINMSTPGDRESPVQCKKQIAMLLQVHPATRRSSVQCKKQIAIALIVQPATSLATGEKRRPRKTPWHSSNPEARRPVSISPYQCQSNCSHPKTRLSLAHPLLAKFLLQELPHRRVPPRSNSQPIDMPVDLQSLQRGRTRQGDVYLSLLKCPR